VREVRSTPVNGQPEQPETYTAVYAPGEPLAEVPPVQEPAKRQDSIPEPREASTGPEMEDQPEAKFFPYDDGREAGNLLLFKMPPEERDIVFDMLLRDREKRAANLT
jgi:ParB family chromosome partitioning protein